MEDGLPTVPSESEAFYLAGMLFKQEGKQLKTASGSH